MSHTPTDTPDSGRSSVARRTVLGAMAAAAATPGILALSSPRPPRRPAGGRPARRR